MNSIKNFFSKSWGYVILFMSAIIGILYFVLNIKNKELEGAKAKIALASTQKQADLIESEIKEKLDQKDLNKRDMEGLQKSLELLEEKRKTLKDDRINDQEKADYWNKKN